MLHAVTKGMNCGVFVGSIIVGSIVCNYHVIIKYTPTASAMIVGNLELPESE